jgi:hypothetical protein
MWPNGSPAQINVANEILTSRYFKPELGAEQVRKEKRCLLFHFYWILNDITFDHQDRLGTNIGKALKNRWRFLAVDARGEG